jgi:endo-1,4-beta-xylanase
MTHTKISSLQRWKAAARHSTRIFAMCLAPLAVGACSTGDNAKSEVAVSRQAVIGTDCGYNITTEIKNVNKKGFRAKIKVTSSTGERLHQPLNVLVNAGSAQLTKVAHGTFQTTSNGYLLTSIDPDDDCDDLDEAGEQEDELLGKKYRFNLKFTGSYTQLTAYMMSVAGTTCDQVAPTVNLTENSNFFTANGTLNLTATASDNVAVTQVVFMQDGTQIGVATAAPYALSIPVTNALNGRHVYSALAYDLVGNVGSVTAGRVLVAINNKFFGTAATYDADYTNLLTYFNQVTPGNAGKWGSVEPTQDPIVENWKWAALDKAYNFAKTNGVPFKLHTLIWGSQQPTWMTDGSLTTDAQFAQIEQWFAALAARYTNIAMIDVVNEPLHAKPVYKDALGGDGVTGWDWVIKAFEMAREYFPNSELILNEYSVIQDADSTASFLTLVNLLKDRGLIDGIGEQGHFYERWPAADALSTNLQTLAATGLPLYVSELDVSDPNDSCQAARLSELFKMFWDNSSVVGVTHWGYLKGSMWRTDAWLVDGTNPRQSLNWIESYRGGSNPTPVTCVPSHVGTATGITLEPELYDAMSGLRPVGDAVGYAGHGSWFGFKGVVFNSNWNKVSFNYAKPGTDPVSMTIHLDSPDSAPVATVSLGDSGGWWTFTTVDGAWLPTSGVHDLYVRYNGGGGNVESVKFSGPAQMGPELLPNSDFETTDAFGWQNKPWGGSEGTVARTTTRALTGLASLSQTGRNASGGIWLWLGSTISGGNTYKVSLSSTIGGAATAGAHVTTMTQCTGGSETYLPLGGTWGDKTLTDGVWTEFSGDLVVPNCILAGAWILLEGPGAGVDLYLDHASLRQVLASNLLPGSNFENGQDGWTTYQSSASVVSDRSHGGTYSLMGVCAGSGSGALQRNITSLVQPGKKYQASAWVWVKDQPGGGIWTEWRGQHNCPESNGFQDYRLQATWIANDSWVQLSGIMDFTQCSSVWWAQVYASPLGGTFYVDDVQLIETK